MCKCLSNFFNFFFFLTADTANRGYYKSYPLMDFSQHHSPPIPFHPMPMHQKDKSYLHQVLPSHDIHSPLSISISSNQLERTRIPKTLTHPQLSSSAFKAWDSGQRHVHRQTSHPGHSALHQTYSSRRHYSIETLPEFRSQPKGYAGQPLYQPYPKRKAYQTNSKTEVTVWGNGKETTTLTVNRLNAHILQCQDYVVISTFSNKPLLI